MNLKFPKAMINGAVLVHEKSSACQLEPFIVSVFLLKFNRPIKAYELTELTVSYKTKNIECQE